ncbi:MAG TPA: ABATE domain-containing protein [Acidobacteriaceae bacterium]|nr:ABATE domain-containing protein [Acidobacteriaceae bacterium]
MRVSNKESDEWIDGFLFVANRPILDFLNTRPVLGQKPTELLPDFHALERWLIASGIVHSPKTKRLLHTWRHSPEAALFLKDLIAFRERLREAVLRIEARSLPSDEFVEEVNSGLLQHPPLLSLRKRGGRIVREPLFDPKRPTDLWRPILDGAADLLSEPESDRIRQCEACVVHFFDTSKKGSRRWCSMNICGNKLKVAAYQRRKRVSASTMMEN